VTKFYQTIPHHLLPLDTCKHNLCSSLVHVSSQQHSYFTFEEDFQTFFRKINLIEVKSNVFLHLVKVNHTFDKKHFIISDIEAF